jgi:hypothetical protein
MFMSVNMFGTNIHLRCLYHWIYLNGYAETNQRHNHPSWMLMPKTVNGITIELECLYRWLLPQNHWMVMPLTVFGINIQLMFGINIQLRCLCHSTWMVMALIVFGITVHDRMAMPLTVFEKNHSTDVRH